MNLPLIEQMVAAAGPDIVEVPIEFKGVAGDVAGNVRVRRLSFKEANEVFVGILSGNEIDPRKVAMSQIAVISKCIVDENGKAVYGKPDIEAWPAPVILAVYEACQKVNGVTKKNAEEAEGKSPATSSSDSDTSSPANSEE